MANKKSPCETCTKVKDPGNCENKLCKEWSAWFLRRWAEINSWYRRYGSGKYVHMMQRTKKLIDPYDLTIHLGKENAKPQTNADRIRAMSDEELAKMFMDFSEKLLNECGVVAEAKTTEYVLEWLKQPVEEVN